MLKGERLALDNQGKHVAGCEGMMIACVSTNMSTVKSHDGHMTWRSCPTVPLANGSLRSTGGVL